MVPVVASCTQLPSPTVVQWLSVLLVYMSWLGDHVLPPSSDRRSRRSTNPWSSQLCLRASIIAKSVPLAVLSTVGIL